MPTLLYDLLKRGVSLCFNTLNVLLGGNLPPFGSAAVIVEEQDCYLVVELPRGRVVFPGGFMTWREDPKHTAQREAQEETGLLVRVDHLIGTYFSASDNFLNMSTVSCVYAAEVIGGVLRNSVEGRACWLHEEELRKGLVHIPRASLTTTCALVPCSEQFLLPPIHRCPCLLRREGRLGWIEWGERWPTT